MKQKQEPNKGRKLAQIEAKSDEQEVGEGVAQAKNYAEKLHLQTTFSTNGKEIYQICMETGTEGLITNFPTPDELWNKTFKIQNNWKEKFNAIPNGGIYEPRFYQEIATNKVLISNNIYLPQHKIDGIYYYS